MAAGSVGCQVWRVTGPQQDREGASGSGGTNGTSGTGVRPAAGGPGVVPVTRDRRKSLCASPVETQWAGGGQ